MLFVVDEFRSWQDRHVAGTAAYAEDEEVLETLAFVLPSQHCNIVTLIASQGDMPQKLSGVARVIALSHCTSWRTRTKGISARSSDSGAGS